MELSTGREVHAYAGILGICVEPYEGEEYMKEDVYYGYDGEVHFGGVNPWTGEDTTWTLAEKLELADMAIARWQEWKAWVQGQAEG